MQENKGEHGEKIVLDELDAVSGGTVITEHRRNITESCDIICPKCGSNDIAGVDVSVFNHPMDTDNFLTNTNLMCNRCHFFAKGRRFKLKTV